MATQIKSPFGKDSIFYTSELLHQNNITDSIILTNDSQIQSFQSRDITSGEGEGNNPDPEVILLISIPFDFQTDLLKFVSGQSTNNYPQGIDKFFEDNKKNHPKIIICAYLKKTAGTLPPIFVYSYELLKSISGEKNKALEERAHAWATTIFGLAKNKPGFGSYTAEQVFFGVSNAMPYSETKFINELPKGKNKAEKATLYDQNYKLFESITENPDDPTVQKAIRDLCEVMVQLSSDVVKTYNASPDVIWNTTHRDRKLNVKDILEMTYRLKELAAAIKKFQDNDFKTGDEVEFFVNKFLYNPFYSGKTTKFIINYSFDNLSYQKRKDILLLLLDGRDLEFKSYSAYDSVPAGAIVYNLLTTGSEEDRRQLLYELEEQQKIFDILNASNSQDFLFNITTIIAHITNLGTEELEANPSLVADLIKRGNFIYFSMELLKDQTENLKAKEKKIELENNGYYNMGGEQAGQLQEYIQEYKNEFSSTKKLFNPLEPIVLLAEEDINSEIVKLKKGDKVIMPACIVYLLFKEDTARAMNLIVSVTTTIIFLPIGVSGLVAAIRAADALRIIVVATDIAADAAYLTLNLPDVQNSEDKKDMEWLNTFIALYGLGRLSYSLKDIKVAELTKDIYKATKELAKEAEEFINKITNRTAARIIEALGTDAKFRVIGKLLIAFANDGKVFFVMDPEGIIVEMKLVTSTADFTIISEVKNAKIKVKKLDNKIFEQYIQLSKTTNSETKEITLRITTPFENGKQIKTEIINQFFERSKNMAPCMEGGIATDRYLLETDEIYILCERDQVLFGGWATNKAFTSEAEARIELALLEAFKPSEKGLVIKKYRIKPGAKVPIRESIAGSLIETQGILKGRNLKGGATQYEFLKFYGTEEDAIKDFFEPILPNIILK